MNGRNLKAIRKLVEEALTDDELLDLCQDDFPAVHNRFTAGQTRDQRISLLIDYVNRQRQIPKLLAAIKEINPIAYAEFAAQQDDSAKAADMPLREAGSENAAPSSPMTETCDVLVLAANPKGTDRLQLEREATLIRQRLQEGNFGREYIVRVEQAVRVEELSRYLLQYKPVIVHFAGHGSPESELILENHQNQAQPVSAEAIAGLFVAVPGQTECVVLNTCFSLELADALAERVRCVIGNEQEIDDEAAVRFAGGFYRGLGFGQGYYKAFELGRAEIQLSKLPAADAPRFITRDMTLLDMQVDSQAQQPRVTRSFVLTETTRQTATLYPVWYGTNRKLINSSDVTKGFSSERDTQIHYGSCQVAVPKSHKIGSTGSAWWKRLLTLADDRLKLDRKSLARIAEDQFWVAVRRALQEHDAGERMALVFIHGFNVSFEDAALRAAQIGFDLQVPGMTAFYSWPSRGKLTGYTADEASIQASESYIAQFLTQFATQSGAERVHIIAHSMGNRGLLRSIQRIVHQAQLQSNIFFGQIFLAAPDEDPDVFRDLATAYQSVAQRTTLYISAKDKALATSGIIHDYPRAGFSPPVTIVPGVDTVEVSNIDLTLLGHGYYGDARDLLQDMHNLLRYNASPEQRFGLREVLAGGDRYWVIGR
jgi:esterase/lipase superfamily enzyme